MTPLFLEAGHAYVLGLDVLISKLEIPVLILFNYCDNSLRSCLKTLSTMTVACTSDTQQLLLLFTQLHVPQHLAKGPKS